VSGGEPHRIAPVHETGKAPPLVAIKPGDALGGGKPEIIKVDAMHGNVHRVLLAARDGPVRRDMQVSPLNESMLWTHPEV
jgi:hypothetical protein